MKSTFAIFLGKTPFLKLLVPLMAGILLQWYVSLPADWLTALLLLSLLFSIVFLRMPVFGRFQYRWLLGLFLNITLIAIGMLLIFIKDPRYNKQWFGKKYQQGMIVVGTLQESPIEKTKSFKADVKIISLINNGRVQKTSGNIIIYFKKEAAVTQLQYGDQILFSENIQEIKNSNNPGSFNYKRYALFNGITHQAYITGDQYKIVKKKSEKHSLAQWLYTVRSYVLITIKKYIHGNKEQGLAEALLIGYKDDLDKKLLQSYSDTGVVHVIAVSGMHLALVYWLLDILLRPLLKRKKIKWMHPVLVLSILWLFTILTGGAASIVRAAVMFSFIMLGKTISRTASIYNILSASAFCLLCYNPYWLWDVGFQLSYAAVLSIVIFYKPIYQWFYIRNKILDGVWSLCAVSIAAQILTTPLSAYHFHQFPVYFLITNLLAVPLSSFILIGELILVLIAFTQPVAAFVGNILSGLIWFLNNFIEKLSVYPFAVWEGLSITILQTILLLILITGAGFWLMYKRKAGLWWAIAMVVLFFTSRAYSFYNASKQKKIIVYNTTKSSAIDFINGRDHYLIAGSAVYKDPFIQKNTIKPSKTLFRLKTAAVINNFYKQGNAIVYQSRKIVLLDAPLQEQNTDSAYFADLVILSGNPKLYISKMLAVIHPAQVVIDGSVPAWKARYWQRDCDSFHIPCHNVVQDGAFVMHLR